LEEPHVRTVTTNREQQYKELKANGTGNKPTSSHPDDGLIRNKI